MSNPEKLEVEIFAYNTVSPKMQQEYDSYKRAHILSHFSKLMTYPHFIENLNSQDIKHEGSVKAAQANAKLFTYF